MDVFVARQPIFDADRKLFAYELLYRSSSKNFFDGSVSSSDATTILINNSYINIGMERLTENSLAFINFDENLIINQVPLLLDKSHVVVEILEDVVPDPQILTELSHLKNVGYTLALDDFTLDYPHQSIIDLADIIKVDFSLSSLKDAMLIMKKYADGKKKFLAEKVETQQEFEVAKALGYELFQGYYFSKPVVIKGTSTRSIKIQYARLRDELDSPEPDFAKIANIMESDVDLSYKLLRMVNSYALVSKINSIRQGLALIGVNELKKWINFVLVQDMMTERTYEIVRISVLRSKFAELIAAASFNKNRRYEASLTGLFSLIDVLLDSPMEDILADLPIAQEVKDAISGKETNILTDILKLVTSYERGDWEAIDEHSPKIKLQEDMLPELYFESVAWTDQFMESLRKP